MKIITRRVVLKLIVILSILFLAIGVLIYDGIIWFVYPEKLGYTVKGVDVARYQGDIDWSMISSQGIQFAFIKATEGSTYRDPFFNTNIVESRKNDIYASAYHFFSSESPGKSQALNFISVVSEYDIDLPPVLDFEIPRDRILEKEDIIRESKEFLEELEMYFGIKPIIYTTHESFNAFLLNEFDNYSLWFRDLLKEPKIVGDRDWLFWQYSNRGRLDGIDKQQRYIDLNVFGGDLHEFNQYINECHFMLLTPK